MTFETFAELLGARLLCTEMRRAEYAVYACLSHKSVTYNNSD
jgi:hypothetical protein